MFLFVVLSKFVDAYTVLILKGATSRHFESFFAPYKIAFKLKEATKC